MLSGQVVPLQGNGGLRYRVKGDEVDLEKAVFRSPWLSRLRADRWRVVAGDGQWL